MPVIRLSVREFAQPLRRHGDLVTAAAEAVLNLGISIHQQIQQRRLGEGDYQRECSLKGTYSSGDYEFLVSGRVDGVIGDGDQVILEEIKTTHSLVRLKEELEENSSHPYLLQLQTYGYQYFQQVGVVPTLRLLLVSSRTKKEEIWPVDFDVNIYEQWQQKRLVNLVAAIEHAQKRRERRQELGEKLSFPFAEQRAGQRELIAEVEDAVTAGEPLLCQAPTGLGKTLGVLLPALRDSLRRGVPLLYVAPKNSQFQVVLTTLRALNKTVGGQLRIQILRARSKICMQDEVQCEAELCAFALGYYDKFHEQGMEQTLQQTAELLPEQMIAWAEDGEMCPYALSHEAIPEADVIVCDYNYVFSPRASLAHLFADKPGAERLNLVVDEAHNLYERAMDYYSPAITLGLLGELRMALESYPPRLAISVRRFLNKITEAVLNYRPSDRKSALVHLCLEDWWAMSEECCRLLARAMTDAHVATEPLMALYVALLNFCELVEGGDSEICTLYCMEEGREGLKAKCLDPSKFLAPTFQEFHGVVAFSATLKPFPFFRKIYGLNDNAREREFQSSFPKANRKVMMIPQVSTSYKDREENYDKIAEAIERITAVEDGHYAVFFPSYKFMDRVDAKIGHLGFNFIKQTPGMTNEDVEAVVDTIERDPFPTMLMAVQGGVLAEGIDFRGERLRGAIVVGPAMPQFDFEREQLRRYYDQRYRSGFAYAYVYPAMARSIQAAGRIIRSEDKRGLLVFLDRRFVDPVFTEALPAGWFDESIDELVSGQVLADIRSFWQAQSGL